MRKGTLKQNGVHLADHEYLTVKLLLENGFDIELIPPSRIKDLRTPDLILNGVPWEMKAPQGDSRRTLRRTIKNAAGQSHNVIIDLRRCKLSEEWALSELQHQFILTKRIHRMKIITKSEKILDFAK